jgi:hypothetical protein
MQQVYTTSCDHLSHSFYFNGRYGTREKIRKEAERYIFVFLWMINSLVYANFGEIKLGCMMNLFGDTLQDLVYTFAHCF